MQWKEKKMNYQIDKKRRMDDTKLLWHLPRIYDRYVLKKRVAPIHIDMGIAKFCQIACVYCYGFYQNPKPIFIQREPLLETMRLAPQIGIKSIGFIGDGEPTCNPHVWEALRVGKENDLDLSISTSGVIVDSEERSRIILENCIWMRFCLSAGTREGYKKIHRKDYFERLKENIKRTVEVRDKLGLKCEVGLQAVFVPTIMVNEMIEESKLAIELGVDYLVIKQCSLPDSGESGMINFDVDYYDRSEVKEALQKCQEMSNAHTEIIPKWNLIMQKGRKSYEFCPSIALISEMSGNGDWFPCGYMFGDKPQFQEYKFGNIHEQSIKEICESERYWRIIEKMENEFDVHKVCRGCCRQDKCNEWIHNYRQLSLWGKERLSELMPPYEPKGVNFI